MAFDHSHRHRCQVCDDQRHRYWTRKELAAALNVTEKTIWMMTVDGRLEPPIKINTRNVRWLPGVLERFNERNSSPEHAGVDRAARK
jgi:predicted DNA-binding transcriptional regulator AlpA